MMETNDENESAIERYNRDIIQLINNEILPVARKIQLIATENEDFLEQ
jgi:hypothetical protein